MEASFQESLAKHKQELLDVFEARKKVPLTRDPLQLAHMSLLSLSLSLSLCVCVCVCVCVCDCRRDL